MTTVAIEQVKGLSGKRGRDLHSAGIESVADLLLHVPRRYIDRSAVVPIDEIPVGQEVTVIGTVKRVSTRRPRRNLTIVEAAVFDGTSYLKAVWFNQPFRARQLREDAEVALSGKVERWRGRLQMSSPAVDVLGSRAESLTTGRVVPVHPTVGGVAPGHLRRAVHNALERAQSIPDPLPAEMVERLGFISRHDALWGVHFPETMDDVARARRRLVFDEFFDLEVALALRKRKLMEEATGVEHVVDDGLVGEFLAGLPYRLTGAQQRTLEEINADLASPHPMHRLLQGEVGSGKTVVALAALLTAVQGGHQGAVMAPTEVLAEQHFIGLSELLAEHRGDGRVGSVRVGYLTSNASLISEPSAGLFQEPFASIDRDELVQRIAEGRVDIAVGTHALIQEGVAFARLGLAVVDEQHRFGVWQRVQLKEKSAGFDPDLLIMTATPIPRTLAMTLYGDLDVSVLDEMPPGRTPVETWSVGKDAGSLEKVYELVRSEAAAGRQTFVVCPLVEDSPKVEAASATAEFERLSDVFSDLRVALIHGQMRPADKERVMAEVRAGHIDVLVATTVIEVGIDVPNATVMIIEDAHRFGLSQLHQLRGRVGRGGHASVCVLVAEPTTDEGEARVAAMLATTDGFVLAEEDLRIRGQGTVFGAKQAGMADLRIADILRDADQLIQSRREAFALVAADPDLRRHPAIAEEVRRLLGDRAEWLLIS